MNWSEPAKKGDVLFMIIIYSVVSPIGAALGRWLTQIIKKEWRS